jgi:hypothetical protein
MLFVPRSFSEFVAHKTRLSWSFIVTSLANGTTFAPPSLLYAIVNIFSTSSDLYVRRIEARTIVALVHHDLASRNLSFFEENHRNTVNPPPFPVPPHNAITTFGASTYPDPASSLPVNLPITHQSDSDIQRHSAAFPSQSLHR